MAEFIHEVLPSYLAPPVDHEAAEDSKGKRKAKKDKDMPKRPPAAYLCYLNGIRASITNAHPEWPMKQVTAEGARRWGLATAEEKAPYIEEAEAHRRKYSKLIGAYRSERGMPPLTSATAKKYAAMEVEDAHESDEDGDEDEGAETSDPESPALAPAPAPKPVPKAALAKLPDAKPKASPKKVVKPDQSPAKPKATKEPAATPAKAVKNANGIKRKAEDPAPQAIGSTGKKNKKTGKASLPSDNQPTKSPKAPVVEPSKKRGRPAKAKAE
ncbi:high mobility group box domain-containing protein [Powellomyces hirtus]|nr:high mobility group box domain-containing protein [Powellomyces hirtus]